MSSFFRICSFVVGCLVPVVGLAKVQEYHLVIAQKQVNLTGKNVSKISVNGKFPAPLLEFEEGDEAVIHVKNELKNQDSSIHWHGLLLPGLMDGVPGFNGFKAIAPQQSFTYRFKVRQSGTYWYHAHSKGQEQDGLYGALVIYPKAKQPLAVHEQVQRDQVIMLSDFHESSSAQIMANLKKSAEYYQNQRETVANVVQQIKQYGLAKTWQQRKMWNQMRMLRTDLSDVTGYTFLVNGQTPSQNWSTGFNTGEKIRLRFINAAAMSFFDVRIPHLKMTVVAADGQAVKPVVVDEFRIGAAETYDVIVEPAQPHYQIQAESIDRSGFALASLQNLAFSPPKLSIPQARPRTLLSLQDMGHTEHQEQVDHAAMGHHIAVDLPQTSPIPTQELLFLEGWSNAATPLGHKALQYEDLISLRPQVDQRTPTQDLVIRLGGTMERYIWTLNGQKYNQAQPLQLRYGDRIRVKFINDSMMAHPMHLHGMFMQLENGQAAENMPNKHTIVVPPGQTVSALLTADEVGEWAIHCHLLYHMSAGMMNKLIVGHVQSGEQHAHH